MNAAAAEPQPAAGGARSQPALALSPLGRARAWLVTGAPGRGLAFAIDFALALRTMLARRRAG